jgi:hypothetical protein
MPEAEQVNKLADVYGINRDIPLNYVSRADVDDVFVDHLTREQHLIIHGSSKQGKTSLRKHILSDDDYIVVTCLNRWDLSELHGAILKKAGYRIEQSEKKTSAGKHKVDAEFVGEGGVPFLAKASGKAGYEGETSKENEKTYSRLELDLHDVNDVVTALSEIEFQKYIVLEDFHYLPVETQRDFSFALKAFHENSKICFIVIGVWKEQNRLIAFNGDLTNRVISINADSWSSAQLRQVIEAGEQLLNITFDKTFADQLVASSSDSVMLVQEACYRICNKEKIFQTQSENKELGNGIDATTLVKEIVDEQKGRYGAFLTNFADGFQATALQMYRWILYPLLKSSVEELEDGLRLTDISKVIKQKHPQGQELNAGNLTQALLYAASLQVKKDIRPIILDYDQTNRRLNVVDRGFLVWLASQNPAELLEMIDLPVD